MLLCLSLALPVSAQTTPAELERRLREIEARIESLSADSAAREIAELRQQIEILSREIEALKLEAAPAAEPETTERQFGLGRAASKVYRSRGVSLGGYGEMLYENFAAERDSGIPSGSKDQLDFLRAVLYTGYKWSDRVVFNSELEVEHATTSGQIGEVSLEFGYLDFLIDPRFNVRAGLLLMPVGLVNELHEPTAFLGAPRGTSPHAGGPRERAARADGISRSEASRGRAADSAGYLARDGCWSPRRVRRPLLPRLSRHRTAKP